MSDKAIWLSVLAAVVLVKVLPFAGGGDAAASGDSEKSVMATSTSVRGKAVKMKTHMGKSAPRVKTERRLPGKPIVENSDDERTPEENLLAERIEKASDDEDFQLVLKCAKEAQFCKNAEVRHEMVDALGSFGEKAIPELLPFLVDPNEEVRDAALGEWCSAVSEIEDDKEKLEVVELAMNVLTDEDALEDISGEYIGTDEKLAVESLVRIILANGSKEGVEKAKETYETVTGDEWKSEADASRWIAEEYEPS